jgi:hypothetical protein
MSLVTEVKIAADDDKFNTGRVSPEITLGRTGDGAGTPLSGTFYIEQPNGEFLRTADDIIRLTYTQAVSLRDALDIVLD